MPKPTCDNESLHCLISEACGLSSSKGFSSRSHSTFHGQLDSAQEPAKLKKRRVILGESCRPRPRDRQLIQDRIKELRELIPNGLKRTNKHMLFMQSITKHAEKLNKCTSQSCLTRKQLYEDYLVMIENINMNGQVLIEMLCVDCSHFLEITEAIRSLGLAILKGITEASGNKTWICFVVEVQPLLLMRYVT
ncbi:hypothetical protein Acr_29g0010110 [Actinidia rufa]|uniref:BHLH domain-containing protein n=1 Tax=Actinidia rufa TaxID=165716 RepID=A0A7J0HFJ3_9ERIC|nr:hypothetical protein Acr_29g0010110 [Actinidia rufa]